MSSLRVFSLISCVLLTVASDSDCWAKSAKKVDSAPDSEPAYSMGNLSAIVAVVGGQAISSFDVENRIKFIIATTGISNTPEMLANVRPQVVHALINESLQLQEATANNITVDAQEVSQAIKNVEAQRGIPQGGVANMLAANNIPEKIFYEQIRAQLAWSKLLAKTVRPRIKISDEEVALASGRISSPAATPQEDARIIKEMEIAVISLPIDKPQREAEIKKLSAKLFGELQKGVRFEEIARQFSASGDAQSFWIRPQQLEPNIVKILQTIKEGSITPPIRTHDGYSIIKLLHVRADKSSKKERNIVKKTNNDFEVTLKEIFLKLKSTASEKDADLLLQIGEEISKNPGNCEEKGVAGVSGLDNFDIAVNMRTSPLSDLPPALRSLSEEMKIGDMSVPFASAEGVRMYMLCGKKEITSTAAANTDRIREGIFRQKFELEAQKYLRDLQRAAFIEVRG